MSERIVLKDLYLSEEDTMEALVLSEDSTQTSTFSPLKLQPSGLLYDELSCDPEAAAPASPPLRPVPAAYTEDLWGEDLEDGPAAKRALAEDPPAEAQHTHCAQRDAEEAPDCPADEVPALPHPLSMPIFFL
ncbi:uncharacterized protein LOC127750867 [Frankliniella occidentalis]|uniref:Uncharacterized protein LOC127750867 n=1 Tax=Frankliniella occidentalis TaxID=133901 RepID=A0A9C6XSY0_FRAOC|nr:uncharacterized protein LOC127750867 [Frankliniella occidentalis]